MDRDLPKQPAAILRTCFTALLLTAAVWLVLSWPLPRHVASAIPSTAVKSADHAATIRFMEPGDHLQLLYHFWLFEDMARGQTPWFHNLYEFNTGDDAARRETGAYYFPFSFFFAVGDAMAGHAFGWNLSGFVALWLTTLVTFHLLRRHETPASWAWALAALCIAFPYRWYNLAGGSPAGFAMCWPPLLFLGLTLAVREDRWRGGFLAGLAILFSAWDDSHVFFFSLLVSPVWCIAALLKREKFPDGLRGWFRLALRLTPAAAALGLALLTSQNMTGTVQSSARGPRKLAEVALSSPHAAGLFSWAELGLTNHVYLGTALAALIAAGIVAVSLAAVRTSRERRPAAVLLLFVLTIIAILALALGINGFHGGLPLRAVRRLIPHYDMIRQPAKILTVLPPLFAVAAAASIGILLASFRNRRAVAAVCAALVGIGFVEYALQFHVVLCSLAKDQPAYAAAARDAEERNEVPRALIVPLWPGDSHFTSPSQYYTSLYRIRMVNGYRPFVPASYRREIFEPFSSINQGDISNEQLDALQQRGIRAIILHEDLFPEKVSPVPVAYTLRALLNHPRLTLLAHAGAVWTWRIENEPRKEITPLGTGWNLRFPSQKSAKANPPEPVKLAVGETYTMPAPEFFHAGTINLERNSVTFDPARDRPGVVFYGPRLPFPRGRYELTVEFTTPAHEGLLGKWKILEEGGDGTLMDEFATIAGRDSRTGLRLGGDFPLLLLFDYAATQPLEINSLTLRRIE